MLTIFKDKASPPISLSFQQKLMDEAIDLAIKEDLGEAGEDITAKAIIPAHLCVEAAVICRQPAVLAGMVVADSIFKRFDSSCRVIAHQQDGAVLGGSTLEVMPVAVATIVGKAGAILSAERLFLNILQRMSGVATLTRQFVDLAKPFGIEILDTRKTTPGLRAFARLAVKIGGGVNHRFGLFDAILIKDNHVRIAGGVTEAVARVRALYPDRYLEVEVENMKEVEEALAAGVDRIMLDNMSPAEVKEAVAVINGRAYVEVSGGVTLDTIKNYLIPGVNGISIGALTHSAPAIDFSLEVERFYGNNE